MPSARAAAGLLCATRRPTTVSVPESGFSAPVMTLISVDFPAPFSPRSACTSPDRRVNETPRSACTPAKDLVITGASNRAIPPSIAGPPVAAQEIRRTPPIRNTPIRAPNVSEGLSPPGCKCVCPHPSLTVGARIGVHPDPPCRTPATPLPHFDANLDFDEETRPDHAWLGWHRRRANRGKPGNLRRRRRCGRAGAQRERRVRRGPQGVPHHRRRRKHVGRARRLFLCVAEGDR